MYFCYLTCVHYFIIYDFFFFFFFISFKIWVKVQTYVELSGMYRAEWRASDNGQSLISNSWGLKARLQVIITFPLPSWILNIHYLLPELGWHRWNGFNSRISTIVLIHSNTRHWRSHCRSDQLDQSRSSYFGLVWLARQACSGSVYLDRHRSCFLHDNFWHVKNIRVGSPSTNSSGSDREQVELIGNRSYRNLVWSESIFPDP